MVVFAGAQHLLRMLGPRQATVIGTVENYPLAKKAHKVETLRDMLHLRPRSYFVRFSGAAS